MNILLIEDDPKLAGFIQKGFQSEQISLEIAYDGLIGQRILEQKTFDAVILDVNLPGINGFDLCRFIKNNWAYTPVMMLTALGTLQDKVMGFHSGADDYLAKPFEFEELLLRIKALARRNQTFANRSKVLKVSDLELDTDSQQVHRAGQRIELTKREFELLEYLMLNKGKIVSRIDILEKVWNLNFDTNTNVIDVYINYLRRKIDKDSPEKLLQTIIGRGYSLREP
ncbi:DNA-binding response regulator, OmpR family, contains REC and winged-helix (wHTH) domain [Pseudarcicella hirudinis]|uniref:DNA-binding response regulator, OmpR family, contains REC and winged-helix (WHTH) domain n=1 Tax=Pseudarcicella hirudinis TaxID=1079859 RepID=A0A1I5LZL6_9BACT|nr:response regulator transcription factor [Pseudarcicella hirudinis]SFP02804.1 DNA-binding response regulator, OmpR family, contains REC and winged-helix (wHTH) domain [Pseudarcicella hirudinis]